MLSSKDFGPALVYRIYANRMVSETQYRILKSHEGFDALRVHRSPSMESKFAVCFAASILRHTIMCACLKRGYDTNQIIQKAARVKFLRIENNKFVFVRGIPGPVEEVLGELGILEDDFIEIASDYNQRHSSSISSQVHKMPTHAGRQVSRGLGRPKGSLNKKTLERMEQQAVQKARGEVTEEPKRRPGRPKGSKDTKPRKPRSDSGTKRGPRKAKD